MTERAAHLVDAVLPQVLVRQWVLTVPYRLRYQMAWNHRLSRAVLRVYSRVLLDVYACGARARGAPGGRTGSVTVMQRAGSGLNTNLHFHTLVLDGVFPAVSYHDALVKRDYSGVSSPISRHRNGGAGHDVSIMRTSRSSAPAMLHVAALAILGLLATTSPAAAQRFTRRIPRLCFLTFDPGTLQTRSHRFDGFFQGLQDLGYVQGRNLDISYLSADNNGDRFPALIDECLGLKPDVIAVTTTPAAGLLKKATSTVPIVMVALGDPLGTGLVDSLSRPSGNITGMSLMVPQLAVKRLELLRELVPGISRVLVLSFLADPIALIQVKAMEESARSLGVTLHVQDVRTPEDIPAAFAAGSRAGVQGALVTEESMFIVHRSRVTELAARHKLPVVYPFVLPVTEAHGLIAYTVKASELYRNAAVYVDRILKGAHVGDLPIQQPTEFELVINLKTAQTLGLTIPAPLRLRATQTIE